MSQISIQIACQSKDHPTRTQIRQWAKQTLDIQKMSDKQLTIRLVNKTESQQLNSTYRHKDKPTNVLSFPMDAPPGVQIPILGDIILCGDVINNEAMTQGKSFEAHWAHMVVHGILHLLGYDHIDDTEAEIMERQEIAILHKLGFADPYGDK